MLAGSVAEGCSDEFCRKLRNDRIAESTKDGGKPMMAAHNRGQTFAPPKRVRCPAAIPKDARKSSICERCSPDSARAQQTMCSPIEARGVGTPINPLPDLRRADARSAQIGGPDLISTSFQVSTNSGEPFVSIAVRNLLSKDV